MTWLREEASGETALDRVFGLRPGPYARFGELYDELWNGGVDRSTLDACRMRIDALVRCEPDPTAAEAGPLDPTHPGVCEGRHSDLTDARQPLRAAVDYAEQYALDPHGLRDEDFVRLHEHYDDAQLATLTLAVAIFDALARFSVALEV